MTRQPRATVAKADVARAFDEACWRANRIRLLHVVNSDEDTHVETACDVCKSLDWAGLVFHNWNAPRVTAADLTLARELLARWEEVWPTIAG